MKKLGSGFIDLILRRDKLDQGLKDAERSVDQSSKKMEGSFSRVDSRFGRVGEGIEKATAGTRKFQGAISGVIGVAAGLLAVFGLIAAAAQKIADQVNKIGEGLAKVQQAGQGVTDRVVETRDAVRQLNEELLGGGKDATAKRFEELRDGLSEESKLIQEQINELEEQLVTTSGKIKGAFEGALGSPKVIERIQLLREEEERLEAQREANRQKAEEYRERVAEKERQAAKEREEALQRELDAILLRANTEEALTKKLTRLRIDGLEGVARLEAELALQQEEAAERIKALTEAGATEGALDIAKQIAEVQRQRGRERIEEERKAAEARAEAERQARQREEEERMQRMEAFQKAQTDRLIDAVNRSFSQIAFSAKTLNAGVSNLAGRNAL